MNKQSEHMIIGLAAVAGIGGLLWLLLGSGGSSAAPASASGFPALPSVIPAGSPTYNIGGLPGGYSGNPYIAGAVPASAPSPGSADAVTPSCSCMSSCSSQNSSYYGSPASQAISLSFMSEQQLASLTGPGGPNISNIGGTIAALVPALEYYQAGQQYAYNNSWDAVNLTGGGPPGGAKYVH